MRLAAFVMFTMIGLTAVQAPAGDELKCEALLLDCNTARGKLEDSLQQCGENLATTRQIASNLDEQLAELRWFLDEANRKIEDFQEVVRTKNAQISNMTTRMKMDRNLLLSDIKYYRDIIAWLCIFMVVTLVVVSAYYVLDGVVASCRWLSNGVRSIIRYITIIPARIKSWWRHKRGRYEEIPMTVRFGDRDLNVSQFQQECINPNSPSEPIKAGDYPKCMFGIFAVDKEFPDKLYYKGYGFWAKLGKLVSGGVFLTAGHVTYDQGVIELVNMNDPAKRVRTSSDKWCHLNEYDVAIAIPKQKVTQKLGLAMANTPNDLLPNRTLVQVYGNGVKTAGMVEPDKSISMVKYNGTTMPGFSGSPYMCNGVAIAVYIGSTAQVAFGMDLHYITMVLKRHAQNFHVEEDRCFESNLPYEIDPPANDGHYEGFSYDADDEGQFVQEGLNRTAKKPASKPIELAGGYYIKPADDAKATVYQQAETLEELERPEPYADGANYIIIVSKTDPFAEYEFIQEGINRWGGKRSRGARSWTTPEWLEHESERLARRGCKMDIYRTGYDDYFVRYMGNSYDLGREDADKLVRAGGAHYVTQDIQQGWAAWQGFHKESYWTPQLPIRTTVLRKVLEETMNPESLEYEYKHEPNGSSTIQLTKNGAPLSLAKPRVISPAERANLSYALVPVHGPMEERSGAQTEKSTAPNEPSTSGTSSKTISNGHTSTLAQQKEVSLDMSKSLKDLEQKLNSLQAFMRKLFIHQLEGKSVKRGKRKPSPKGLSGSTPDLRML